MPDGFANEPFWLGTFIGAQVLVVFLCVVKAGVYGERPLLLHAATTVMAVFAEQALVGEQRVLPYPIFLFVLALAGLQLLDLLNHAGALRRARRWLLGTSAIALPVLAIGSYFELRLMPIGMGLWATVVMLVLYRAWRQCQPWAWWLVPGIGALVASSFAIVWDAASSDPGATLLVAGLLTAWSASIYIATGWRGRIFGETRARINARNTVDPLTGLATPLVLGERIHAARNLMRRYGHPSVLMLVQIENLARLAEEFGPEASETAVLAAASRVRESLVREGDVAVRMTHARFAVLAEGAGTGEAANTVATRILVAGLKEPVPGIAAEFLRFRIVMAGVPIEDVPPKLLLHRMGARLDQELKGASERRIVTLTREELIA